MIPWIECLIAVGVYLVIMLIRPILPELHQQTRRMAELERRLEALSRPPYICPHCNEQWSIHTHGIDDVCPRKQLPPPPPEPPTPPATSASPGWDQVI